jgi:hypothetical protein
MTLFINSLWRFDARMNIPLSPIPSRRAISTEARVFR